MSDVLRPVVLDISELKAQIDEILLGLCVCKYNTRTFLTRLIEIMKTEEPDVKEVFIDSRLYNGPDKLERYKQDCNSLLECIDMFRMWSDMIEGFEKLKDPKNSFVIRDNFILVLEGE